jgi:hypothetical protein
MSPKPNGKYREVHLRKDGEQFVRPVNCYVLEAFVGPCPSGMECRHLDGDVNNNNLQNLVWGTHLQNMRDSIKHGTFSHGSKHAAAIMASVKRGVDGRYVKIT